MVFHWVCVVSLLFQVVLVFPGPGAVSVQDMMQCLHNRTDSRSHNPSGEPCIKRLKRDEDATHSEGTPDEVKGSESRAFPLERVVFIDSTWNQTNKISTDERLQGNHERLHLCSFSKSSDCLWLLGANLPPSPSLFNMISPCVLGFSLTDMCSLSDLLQVELKMRKTCFWRHQKGKPDTYLATIEAIYYFLKDFHEHCLAQEYNAEYDNLLFFYSYLHSVVKKAKTSAGKCWF